MPRRLIAAAAFLLLVLPFHLFAQDAAFSVEFDGTIQSANETAIVINGQIVDIQTAQINTPLTAGTEVHVQAEIEPDGSLVARQIDPVSPGLIPGTVQIVGVIEAIDGTTLTLSGQQVDISDAQVVGELNVGELVRISAKQTAPGHWTANFLSGFVIEEPVSTPEVLAPVSTPEVAAPEVIAPVATPEVLAPVSTPEILAPVSTPEVNASGEDSEHFTLEGVLQAADSATITVNNQRLLINGARIEGTLTPGVQVRVEASIQNGQVVVKEIEVLGSDDHGGNSGGDSNGGSGNSGSGSNGSNNSGSSNDASGSSNSGGSGSGGNGSGNSSSGSSSSNGSGSSNSGSGGDNSGHGSGGGHGGSGDG